MTEGSGGIHGQTESTGFWSVILPFLVQPGGKKSRKKDV